MKRIGHTFRIKDGLITFHSEDGGGIFLQNFGKFIQHYLTSYL
jgi:hypothetical protein